MEQRSRSLAERLNGTLPNQMVLVLCNVGAHWILTVIDPYKEEIGISDPLYKGIHDGKWKQVVDVALKMFIAAKNQKAIFLFFYPLDFTFVCPTEITAFSDRYEEFQKLNTEVLGVSIDSVFSHLAWVQTDRKSGGLGDLQYPLVSDVTKSISKSYGVLIPDQGIAL